MEPRREISVSLDDMPDSALTKPTTNHVSPPSAQGALAILFTESLQGSTLALDLVQEPDNLLAPLAEVAPGLAKTAVGIGARLEGPHLLLGEGARGVAV